jgi:hypothetical protein
MKQQKSKIIQGALAMTIIAIFANCINQGAAITLTGRAVNPRKQVSSADYAMTETTVERIEAIPQAATGNEGVQTGFFTSTSKTDSAGNFKVMVSPGSRTLLVATLKDKQVWQAMIDAKDADAALGDVVFVDPKTTVFNLCWSANGDHDVRLLNTSSGSHWGFSGTGSTAEATLDFDVQTASGCENITLLQNSGAKYVFAVARFSNTIDFRTVSVPQARLITGNGITTVTASASSTGCGAADRWWAAFSYQNGVVTVLNKCSNDTSSDSAIPATIQN